MGLFKFHYDNKVYLIFMTSLIWAFNFRTTFKNIDVHMGLGSYSSLKYEPFLYLIKNIICIFYFIVFFIELRINKSEIKEPNKVVVQKKEGNMIYITTTEEKKDDANDMIKQIEKSKNLDGVCKKILFCIKIFFMILFICIVEDAYFICSNNHVIDRVICPIRNFSMLISLAIFSLIIMKQCIFRNRHQYIPFLIIFFISAGIIIYNYGDIDRFKKKFSAANMIVYMITFFCMGIEMIFIKLLSDSEYLSIYLILGLKGVIGTIVSLLLYLLMPYDKFFDIFDKNFNFEYEFLKQPFPIYSKILYIISLVILEYFKVYTINQFSENHIVSCMMIVDIIYFPIYCIERFAIQGFSISTPRCFWPNMVVGIINCFLMLIFNEILECKFWGLNTNLKVNIDKRANKIEKEERLTINSGDDNDSFTTEPSIQLKDLSSKNKSSINES